MQEGRGQRDAACGGDRRRAITAERRAGRKLAADGDDVCQRLVEIAHLFGLHALLPPAAHSLCDTKYTALQSRCKGPEGDTRTTPGCLSAACARKMHQSLPGEEGWVCAGRCLFPVCCRPRSSRWRRPADRLAISASAPGRAAPSATPTATSRIARRARRSAAA